LDKERVVVDDVLASLGMREAVRDVYIETTDSPWNEKVMVKRKKDHLDVKITVWKDNSYLYGRIYRLFLYIHDIRDTVFQYDPARAPKESEKGAWDLYSQTWGIYVDSRLERARIPDFYDRVMRRNLFTEACRELPWKDSFRLFDVLWQRERFTHAEIIQYAYAPETLLDRPERGKETLEVEIGRCLREHSVRRHLDRLESDTLKSLANEILSFTVYHCKGALIRSSYYGIHFDYKKTTFGELIPSGESMLLTLRDFHTGRPRTMAIAEQSDLEAAQKAVKDLFTMHFLDSQSA